MDEITNCDKYTNGDIDLIDIINYNPLNIDNNDIGGDSFWNNLRNNCSKGTRYFDVTTSARATNNPVIQYPTNIIFQLVFQQVIQQVFQQVLQ